MKALITALVLALSIVVAKADCRGAATLVATKVDATSATAHITAIMTCDDGTVTTFKSRESTINVDTPREVAEMFIQAMAQETVEHFKSLGMDNSVEDLLAHLKVSTQEPVPPLNSL